MSQILTYGPTSEVVTSPPGYGSAEDGNYSIFFLNLPTPVRIYGFNFEYKSQQFDPQANMFVEDTFYLVPWTIGFDNRLGLASGEVKFSVGGGGTGTAYVVFPTPFPFPGHSRNIQLVIYTLGYRPGSAILFIEA